MLGTAAGIAHLVAVVGLVRARAWAPDAVTYLAMAGIGVAVFALLMIARAGEAILGAGDAYGHRLLRLDDRDLARRHALRAQGLRPADGRDGAPPAPDLRRPILMPLRGSPAGGVGTSVPTSSSPCHDRTSVRCRS